MNPISSKKGTWIALAGLAAVPVLAVVAVVSLDSRDEEKVEKDPARTAARPVAEQPVRADEPDRPARPAALTARQRPIERAEPSDEPSGDTAARALAKIDESRRIENTDPARARALLREALAIDPHNETALERLSVKLLIDENNAEARALAERCLVVSDVNDACAAVRENTIEDGPDIDRLVQGTEKCLEETPDNLMCLYGMVNYHLMQGEQNDAAMFLGRLTQVSPDNPFTRYSRARLHAASGKYSEALPLFQEVCRIGNEQACVRADALRSEGW